jgi:hypothetical protein
MDLEKDQRMMKVLCVEAQVPPDFAPLQMTNDKANRIKTLSLSINLNLFSVV